MPEIKIIPVDFEKIEKQVLETGRVRVYMGVRFRDYREVKSATAVRDTLNGTVLDAGCAWGRDSIILALQKCRVVGVDLDLTLLRILHMYAR